MNLLRVFLLSTSILFTALAVSAAPRSCKGLYRTEAKPVLQLISPAQYQEIIESEDLNFKLQRKIKTSQSQWRSEAVGVIQAPADFVYQRAQDIEGQIEASPLLKLLAKSSDQKSITVGLKIPMIGSIQQKIYIDPNPRTRSFHVRFEEGPFEGLEGDLQIFAYGRKQSEVRGVFQGDLENRRVLTLLPVGIVEKMTLSFLKSMKEKMEQESP